MNARKNILLSIKLIFSILHVLYFLAVLTPPNSNIDDLNNSLKTPERTIFENTIEGLPEETEEEQWEQNLRASISADTILTDDDGEEDSSDSDLE